VHRWSNLATSVGGSCTKKKNMTSTGSCSYIFVHSWWWVWLTPETCRVNSQNNRLLCVASRWTIIDTILVVLLSCYLWNLFYVMSCWKAVFFFFKFVWKWLFCHKVHELFYRSPLSLHTYSSSPVSCKVFWVSHAISFAHHIAHTWK